MPKLKVGMLGGLMNAQPPQFEARSDGQGPVSRLSTNTVENDEEDTGLFHPGYPRATDTHTSPVSTVVPPSLSPTSSGSRATDKSEEYQFNKYEIGPLIVSTATTAQWRRRGSSWDSGNGRQRQRLQHRQLLLPPQQPDPRSSATSVTVPIASMEEVHGVDVSWLHHPSKDKDKDRAKDKPGHKRHISAAPVFSREARLPEGTTQGVSQQQQQQLQQQEKKKQDGKQGAEPNKLPSPPNITPPTAVQPTQDTTQAVPSTPTPASNGKATPKRPNLMGRQSSEKLNEDGKTSSRRQSWMNSISSKFSSSPSQPTPPRPGPTPTQVTNKSVNGAPLSATRSTSSEEAVEDIEPYTPPKQKESSFFSSLSRRLSSGSQIGGIPKAQGAGSVCARKVLNVDPNRERCLVPEMDPNRLRKVSFCVDVEIAGGPRYEDDEDDDTRDRKKKDFKMRERAEGEALKNPETLKEEKDEEGEPKLESKGKGVPIPSSGTVQNGSDENLGPKNSLDDDPAAARKREKKKKSEEERKDRKEKRRRKAEENGSIPVEVSMDGEGDDDTKAGSPPSSAPTPSSAPKTPQQAQASQTPQARPTTDPARVYRRCCQLRETPILKRITEQLMNPKVKLPADPGIVNLLDLTGSRLQLADVVSLGDWLAVVPVKHLKFEDADLSDEGVRCILAGLLAAKIPEPPKRKSLTPKHRQSIQQTAHRERAGYIERITFKNNPRITRAGWKHISLFLYMCRSIKAIDLSMNQFPDTLPPSAHNTPAKSPPPAATGKGDDIDAAEALNKCLSERLAGAKLEELIMSECALSAQQIRKIVDGAMICGVSRLGLAGNHLDDEGLEYVLTYLRSNVCQALDLGGNDLRGKLGIIAEAIRSKAATITCWGLSFAGCNLDSQSLKPLFTTLQELPDFRFIDLSHNPDLCSEDSGLISLLRRYIGKMRTLKRVHLNDVGMSSSQAIALAEVLAEGPRLAHVNLLENPKLTALAHAKTEEEQEEACALYASLMAAVRVSSTLICIDIDVSLFHLSIYCAVLIESRYLLRKALSW